MLNKSTQYAEDAEKYKIGDRSMGFLSNRYTRPGPGVDPDAPQKRAFFRFFDIFFRKLTHFAKVNLLYAVTGLITAIPIFILIFTVFSSVVYSRVDAELAEYAAYLTLIWAFFCTNLYVTVMGVGPATAGITYILRNFAREEHAWIWSDFKDAFKDNFKQAIVVYLIDLVTVVLLYIALMFYTQSSGFLGYLRYVVYMIILIYAMMHLYIYPIMVTFKLSIKDIYRNALLFAMGKLPSNLLILIIAAFVHVGLPCFLIPICGNYFVIMLVIFAVLEVFVTQAMMSFMVNFGVYPKLKTYMLDPAMSGEEKKREETLFDDDIRQKNRGRNDQSE